MFARFRQTPNRLQISLVETRRVGGRVRHQHVAALGSIPEPWSIGDRITFWSGLHQRLARLSNRIKADDLHKLMAAIHDRVPMPMTDEQRRLQRDNAEQDLTEWSGLHSLNESLLADNKAVAAKLAKKIAEMEASTAKSAASVDAAKERLAKIDRGDEVSGGLSKPPSFEDILLASGLSKADIEHCRVVGTMNEAALYQINDNEKRQRAAARAILRRQLAEQDKPQCEISSPIQDSSH